MTDDGPSLDWREPAATSVVTQAVCKPLS